MRTARGKIEALLTNGIRVPPRIGRKADKSIHAATRATELSAFVDTDIANAVRLAQRHGFDLKFTAATDYLVWDGQRWRVDEKVMRLQAMAKETALSIFDEIKTARNRDSMMAHAKRSQSKAALEAMIALARSEPGIPAVITDFDTDPLALNVSNGTIDLAAAALRPHDRGDLITKLVPIAYDPAGKCELWERFLRRACGGHEELCNYLRRVVGYLLTGKTTEQVLHFLYGGGANGKSVFCEIVADLLGDYAVIASPELVMARRYSGIPNDIARLRGGRVVLMNETSQGSRFDEAKLKDLTGSDSLTGRFLHREFFDFRPTHKLVIRGNYKPTISGTDEGIWRRLRLVPFTVAIPPEEQDRHLLEKLRAELPGILRWAVQGCLEWQRDGLKPPAIITEAVRQYREESDTLGRFIAECCEVRKLAQVKSSVFFHRYQQCAEQAGERWIPSKDLPHEMQRRGFEWKHTNTGSKYFGIELSTSGESN
jgi:putative DNA primase/helicase